MTEEANFVRNHKLKEQFLHACRNGDIETVEKLLTNPNVDPANGEKGSYWYQEPLKIACWSGHVDIVRRLLQDPRVDPSVVHVESIVTKGHTEIVRLLLLDGRAHPAPNGFQSTLELACLHGYPDIVLLLLQDPRIDPFLARETAMSGALRTPGASQIEAVRHMLADPRVNPGIPPDGAKILATIPVLELRAAMHPYRNRIEQLMPTVNHLIEKKRIRATARNVQTLKAVGKHGFGNLPNNVRLHMGSLLSGKVGPNLQSQINQLKGNYYGPRTRRTRKRASKLYEMI